MPKLKNSLVVLIGLIVVVSTLALLTPRSIVGQKAAAQPSTIPPPLNVNVVNTPLPVTGTISVGNLGDSPLPVRDVDNPTRQPVHFGIQYTVPAGKRLVIEYISAKFRTPPTCGFLQAKLLDDLFNESELHSFYPTFVGTVSTGRVYGLSQETKIYVEENKSLGFETVSENCNVISSQFAVSGHLVDIP